MLKISGKLPAAGEKNVSLDTNIEFSILDDGNGIDISTLIIEVGGFRVFEDLEFAEDFDGPFSEVTPSGDDYTVLVDPVNDFDIGVIVEIKIQVKDYEGNYLNDTWTFKTIPAEPQLVDSSPENDSKIDAPQYIYFEFEDLIDGIDVTSLDISINGLPYIVSGVIESAPNGPLSAISTTDDGIIVRINPVEPLKVGDYVVTYSVADPSTNFLKGSFIFSVKELTTLPSDVKQIGFDGFFQGIKKASDIGCGDSIKLEWHKPIIRSNNYEAFVLVYQNEKRLEVFDPIPSFIAPASTLSGTVTGLTPGVTLSYGVRAMEAIKNMWDLSSMEEMDDSFYIIPEAATVASKVLDSGLRVETSSLTGWPDFGLIKIGSEVMSYEAITNDTFNISQRGLFGTSNGIYLEGDSIELFFACQDSNTVIVMATPSYDGYQSGREINSTGILVPDFSDNDKKFFQGFDFCGYHHPLPQQILQGTGDCGSYIGGEFNKMRGMNLYDRMLNREEILLDQVGEPTVLLRRIWDGEKCVCATSRRDHPKLKSCADCFGTTYSGGYQQFLNMRREDRRVMLRFKEAPEDLKHGEHEHLRQEFEPQAWTLPMPAIKDRDIVIRFDFTDDVEYIYEVLDSSREKLIFRHFGRQNVKLKRMDKTDILYTLIKSAIIDNTFLPTIK